MVVPRSAVSRGFTAARLARSVPRPAVRRNIQPVLRRGYASGGDAHGAASSDIPWLAGAIAVTLPGCYFLWPEASHGDAHHGHGAHKEEKHEETEEEPEEPKEEEAPAEEEKPEEPKEDEPKSEEKEEPKEDKSEDKPEEKKEEAPKETSESKPGKVEGVQGKGKTSAGDEDNEMTDTRKREPDSKGAFKKRIDSDYRKELGEGEHKDEDGSPSGATNVKPSGNDGAIDTKQKGISTTPTRHSTAIDEDPEKSKKGEGVPETAKSQTTVDPNRPAK